MTKKQVGRIALWLVLPSFVAASWIIYRYLIRRPMDIGIILAGIRSRFLSTGRNDFNEAEWKAELSKMNTDDVYKLKVLVRAYRLDPQQDIAIQKQQAEREYERFMTKAAERIRSKTLFFDLVKKYDSIPFIFIESIESDKDVKVAEEEDEKIISSPEEEKKKVA